MSDSITPIYGMGRKIKKAWILNINPRFLIHKPHWTMIAIVEFKDRYGLKIYGLCDRLGVRVYAS